MAASVDLAELLVACAKGCLLAQQYIVGDMLGMRNVADSLQRSGAHSILQLPPEECAALVAALGEAVRVEVKGNLAYKQGATSQDLVTSADVLSQEVVVAVLLRHFPEAPFTLVGEEEPEKRGNVAPHERAEAVLRKYSDQFPSVPHEADLRSRLPDGAMRMVFAASLPELRARVGIFIDPIDATNCFVEGVWEAPMTLVGITVDGVPVAAVVNRVFHHDGMAFSAGHAPSLSYVWNFPSGAGTDPFLVFNGELIALGRAPVREPRAPLPDCEVRVACSSTTLRGYFESALEALHPAARVDARGAGNKLFYLVKQSLVERGLVPVRADSSDGGVADVFLCPGSTIMKWDTCAPHAFLLALGGEIRTTSGATIRYPLVPPTRSAEAGESAPAAAAASSTEAEREFRTVLPDAVVAVRSTWSAEVLRRLQRLAPPQR